MILLRHLENTITHKLKEISKNFPSKMLKELVNKDNNYINNLKNYRSLNNNNGKSMSLGGECWSYNIEIFYTFYLYILILCLILKYYNLIIINSTLSLIIHIFLLQKK